MSIPIRLGPGNYFKIPSTGSMQKDIKFWTDQMGEFIVGGTLSLDVAIKVSPCMMAFLQMIDTSILNGLFAFNIGYVAQLKVIRDIVMVYKAAYLQFRVNVAKAILSAIKFINALANKPMELIMAGIQAAMMIANKEIKSAVQAAGAGIPNFDVSQLMACPPVKDFFDKLQFSMSMGKADIRIFEEDLNALNNYLDVLEVSIQWIDTWTKYLDMQSQMIKLIINLRIESTS